MTNRDKFHRDQTETNSSASMQTITRQVKEGSAGSVVARKGSSAHRSEVHIDSETGGVPPDPFESSVHGREVHVAKQKQTQKEVQGQLEITRKITATETTEVEHKARTQERVVQGQVVNRIVPISMANAPTMSTVTPFDSLFFLLKKQFILTIFSSI